MTNPSPEALAAARQINDELSTLPPGGIKSAASIIDRAFAERERELVKALEEIAGGWNLGPKVNAAIDSGDREAFREHFGAALQGKARAALAKVRK